MAARELRFLEEGRASERVVVTVGEIRRLWRETVRGCEVAADRFLDPCWYESTARIRVEGAEGDGAR